LTGDRTDKIRKTEPEILLTFVEISIHSFENQIFMKSSRFMHLVLPAVFILMFSLPAHSQWVTIARKIKGMVTPQTDVATVLLDAKPYKVYKAVVDTLSTDPKFTITAKDDNKRKVNFNRGNLRITMQVDSLAAGLAQVTVAVPHSDDPTGGTDMAVEAILKISKKAGIKCSVQ
jgi:hypothetical protein